MGNFDQNFRNGTQPVIVNSNAIFTCAIFKLTHKKEGDNGPGFILFVRFNLCLFSPNFVLRYSRDLMTMTLIYQYHFLTHHQSVFQFNQGLIRRVTNVYCVVKCAISNYLGFVSPLPNASTEQCVDNGPALSFSVTPTI